MAPLRRIRRVLADRGARHSRTLRSRLFAALPYASQFHEVFHHFGETIDNVIQISSRHSLVTEISQHQLPVVHSFGYGANSLFVANHSIVMSAGKRTSAVTVDYAPLIERLKIDRLNVPFGQRDALGF